MTLNDCLNEFVKDAVKRRGSLPDPSLHPVISKLKWSLFCFGLTADYEQLVSEVKQVSMFWNEKHEGWFPILTKIKSIIS